MFLRVHNVAMEFFLTINDTTMIYSAVIWHVLISFSKNQTNNFGKIYSEN